MRVKLEIELEVITDWTEVEGCTPENFKEHVESILRNELIADHSGDLEYVSVINKIEFLNNSQTAVEHDKTMELEKKYEYLRRGYENICEGFHNYVKAVRGEECIESWHECGHPVCEANREFMESLEK